MRAWTRRLGLARVRRALRAWGAVVVAALVCAAPASAGSFPVVNTNDSGAGSLRQAITDANASGDSSNTIPISSTGMITLQSALPTISKPMQIQGPGPGNLEVHGQACFPCSIFQIASGVTAGIDGVKLSGGSENSGGGGILNRGTLTVTNATVTGNSSANGGGGILNAGGTLSLDNSTVSNNFTGGGGGGGGGIYNSGGVMALSHSTVSNNMSPTFGGGLANSGGNVTLTGSTVSGNTAGERAGGLDNGGTGAVMTIDSSTVSGNMSNGVSGGGGGGIQNDGTGVTSAPPQLTIVNSTIANNTAANNGGGVDTFDLDSNPSVTPTTTIASSTVAANSAGGAGGGLNEFQGNYTISNSIVARNAAGSNPDCSNVQPNSPPFGSEGYNLVGTTTGCTGFTGVGDLVKVDPLLAGSGSALTNNGGPTETIALLVGSPALHAGNPATPGSGGLACPAVEQRGLARGGAAGRCDIGAVQPGPPTITITAPANGATLAQGQAVAASYSCTADPSTTIALCKGPVADGSPIDTSTLGPHTVTVNATDALGASSTSTSNYAVATTPVKPKITKTTIDSTRRTASFKFTDTGVITGYQCALIKRRKKLSKPHFISCRSPKTYKHLKHGKYTVEVQALVGTLVGPPAKRKFTI